jgi:quercetin dioxygenase-like cupin family protein
VSEPRLPFDPQRFRWARVEAKEYKSAAASAPRGMAFNDVTRFTLGAPEELPAAYELRYFEFEPGGYSSLEKHRHSHFVIVLRGEGRALVGHRVLDCRPFDAVHVPPLTPHRWINAGSEPFGFLCPVDRDRDRPQPVDDTEWEELKDDPVTAPYVF